MDNITVAIIKVDSPEYAGVFELRDEVLRKPLGMRLKNDDLSRDYTDTIFAAIDGDKVVGCLMLHHIDAAQLQLRQMAVAGDCQGKGVGRKIVQAAEQFAAQQGYSTMILHARKIAVGFYSSMGYTTTGNEFMEVGIPHYIMQKPMSSGS